MTAPVRPRSRVILAVSAALLLAIPTTTPATAAPAPATIARSAKAAPKPVPPVRPSPAAARRDRPAIYRDGCHLRGAGNQGARGCWYGDPKGKQRIVLLGDSHAANVMPGLDRAARLNGWRLFVVTRANCPGANVTVRVWKAGRVQRWCNGWRRDAYALIKRTAATEGRFLGAITVSAAIHQVVGRGNVRLSGERLVAAWRAGTLRTIRELGAVSDHVVVLRDNPRMPWDAPACVARNRTAPSRCWTAINRAVPGLPFKGVREAVAQSGGKAVALDASGLYCAKRVCPAVGNGILRYRDTDHLTATFATSLAPAFAQLLARAFPTPVTEPPAEARPASVTLSQLRPSVGRAPNDRPVVYANGCHLRQTQTRARACWFGAPRGTRTLLLTGDSHAVNVLPALDVAARARNWRLLVVTKAGCPAVPLDVRVWQTTRRQQYCAAWRASAARVIRANGPYVAVVTVAASAHQVIDGRNRVLTGAARDRAWQLATTRFIRQMSPLTARVVILRDNPVMPGLVPSCLRRNPSNFAACGTTVRRAIPVAQWAAQRRAVVAAGSRAASLDLSRIYCSATRCEPVAGRIIRYRDANHFTTTYARSIGTLVGRALDRVL